MESPTTSPAPPPPAPIPLAPAVKDPVCGMTVVPGTAKGATAAHAGHDYWFCNPKCHDKFVANPAKYVGAPAAVATPPAPAGTTYTCPMHPEIRQSGPGDCPKCGMALEPDVPVALAVRTEWVCPMHAQIVRSEVPGVRHVEVSLPNHTATGELDDGKTSVDAMRTAVRAVGYDIVDAPVKAAVGGCCG